MSRVVDSYELSPLQAQMLDRAAGAAEPGVDIEQVIMTTQEPLDEALFLHAWDRLVERHAILRTRFKRLRSGEPRQEVVDRARIPVERFDAASLERVVDEQRARGFDVTQAPLMRLALAQKGGTRTVLWTFHSLLLDDRSRFILLRELFACYEALTARRELSREVPRPYRDYVEWLRTLDPQRAKNYWQRALAGVRAPTPLGVARGTEYATQEWRLPARLTSALRKRARAARITLGVLLQAAWALTLHRYSGERDVMFGVTRAGRPSALEGAAAMIGVLANTVPFRLRIDPDAELLTWLAALRRPLLDQREYEHTPLAQVQAWSEVPNGTPLFDSVFVYADHTLDAELRGQGGKWSSRQFRTLAQSSYPLALAAYGDEQLVLQLQYSRGRLADDGIRRLGGQLQTLLEGMAGDPRAQLRDLLLLMAEQRWLGYRERGERLAVCQECLVEA